MAVVTQNQTDIGAKTPTPGAAKPEETKQFFHCEHCDFKSTVSKYLDFHLFNAHGLGEPFACKVCDFKTVRITKFLHHLSAGGMSCQNRLEYMQKMKEEAKAEREKEKKPEFTKIKQKTRIFSCDHCSAKYVRVDSLHKHNKANHSNAQLFGKLKKF